MLPIRCDMLKNICNAFTMASTNMASTLLGRGDIPWLQSFHPKSSILSVFTVDFVISAFRLAVSKYWGLKWFYACAL